MKNRLVMPPLATEKSAGGIVTDDLLEYDSVCYTHYREQMKGVLRSCVILIFPELSLHLSLPVFFGHLLKSSGSG